MLGVIGTRFFAKYSPPNIERGDRGRNVLSPCVRKRQNTIRTKQQSPPNIEKGGRGGGISGGAQFFVLPTVFWVKNKNEGIEKLKTLNGRTVGRIFLFKKSRLIYTFTASYRPTVAHRIWRARHVSSPIKFCSFFYSTIRNINCENHLRP